MTQEQADEKLEVMKNKPVIKGKGHSWSGHWHKRPMKEDISEQLRRAVESGKMTQEQADEKLEAMNNKPVVKGKGHHRHGHWFNPTR